MKNATLFMVLALFSLAQAQVTVVYHYLPTLSLEQAESYRGYDRIVVDPEAPFSSPRALEKMRRDNPNLLVLCYINVAEIFDPMFPDKPWSNKMLEFYSDMDKLWLRGVDGNRISFWPGMKTLNCAIDAPRVPFRGKMVNHVEFLSIVFTESILKNYAFDGVVGDNAWDKGYWLGHYGNNQFGVDRNNDGVRDDSLSFDTAWKLGVQYFISEIRRFGGPNYLIIGNPANLSYMVLVNGKNFEHFPDIYVNELDSLFEAWYDNLRMAAAMPIAIFNSRYNDPKNTWFTLLSSQLLDNVWFADAQNTAYDARWKLELGKPLGEYVEFGKEVVREFENGRLFVNPGLQTGRIHYNSGVVRDEL